MPRRPESRDVQVSKKMSWLLRHGAQKEGLKMDEAGFVNCADLLNNRTIKSFHMDFQELQEMVTTNAKKRFELIPTASSTLTPSKEGVSLPAAVDPSSLPPSSITETDSTVMTPPMAPNPILSASSSPKDFLIRASQGHSLKGVSSALLLTPLDPSSPRTPPLAVHATTSSAWTQIQKTGGLSRMGRAHVHFTTGTTTAATTKTTKTGPSGDTQATTDSGNNPDDDAEAAAAEIHGHQQAPVLVTAGFRNSRPTLIWVDVKRSALEGALKWWVSANGVVLTEGDEKGFVGLDWIERVERRVGGGRGGGDGKVEVIWRRGDEKAEGIERTGSATGRRK